MFFQKLGWPLNVYKHLINPSDIWHTHFLSLSFLSHQTSYCNQLNSISQSCLCSNFSQKLHGILCQLNVFFFASDLQNLWDLFLVIVCGWDDKQSIQQIQWHSMRAMEIILLWKKFTFYDLYHGLWWSLCWLLGSQLELCRFLVLCLGTKNTQDQAYALHRWKAHLELSQLFLPLSIPRLWC